MSSFVDTQQKLLRVNARFRSSGTTGVFRSNFEARDLDAVRSISLLRATLNRTFPNIFAPINVINYNLDDFTSGSITVPPGQYTSVQLAAAIQLAAGNLFTVTYNTTTNRFIFTFNGSGLATAADLQASSSIANYIGLTANTLIPAVATPTSLPSPPQLQGPATVYIESDWIAGSHCVDSAQNGSYIPFLGAIDFSAVPWGFDGVFISQTPIEYQVDFRRTSGSRSLNNFDIYLTDEFGNVLALPDNAFLDAHLVFYF